MALLYDICHEYLCHEYLCHDMNVCHDMKLNLTKDEKTQNFEQ